MSDSQTTNDWYWNIYEDGCFNGPYATKDEAIDDAVHGNAAFEEEETEVIFLLNGRAYPNPEFDPDYPKDEDNAPENLSGKTEQFTKTQALEWCLKQIDELRAKIRKEAA